MKTSSYATTVGSTLSISTSGLYRTPTPKTCINSRCFLSSFSTISTILVLLRPLQNYAFVFINTKASSEAYGLFKQVFLQLTIDHFLHLREFILVRPTYYHRAQDYMSFCVLTNYLRNLTRHFYSCA